MRKGTRVSIHGHRVLLAAIAALALAALGVAGAAAVTTPVEPATQALVDEAGARLESNVRENAGLSALGSQAEALPCAVNALGRSPIAHGVPELFPAALAAAGSETQAEAIATARELAAKFGGSPAPSSALAVAREVPYAQFLSLAGWPANPSINPERCVWVVTVHAPMAVKVRPGMAPQSASVYTVALDAGSGTLIGLTAGRALITGP